MTLLSLLNLAIAATAVNAPARDHWRDFIKTQVVHAAPVTGVVNITGRVSFDEDHTQRIASPFDGRVTGLMVRPGDAVRVGQALLSVTSPQVAELLAENKKAAQDLDVAQKALARTRTLQADGAVSAKEAAQTEADFYKARAEAERSSAQLRALGIGPSEDAQAALASRIRGTVVERTVLTGQEVRADGAQPLLTITDLDTVWVLADVYEQDLGLVARDAEVRVRVPAYPGEEFVGRVAYVGDVVDPESRTVKVRCVLPNPRRRLKPEMFAKVAISYQRDEPVIAVPTRALLNDGDNVRVVVADGDKFLRRDVQVGAEVNGQRQVLRGLLDGDVIVTEGAIFLQNELY